MIYSYVAFRHPGIGNVKISLRLQKILFIIIFQVSAYLQTKKEFKSITKNKHISILQFKSALTLEFRMSKCIDMDNFYVIKNIDIYLPVIGTKSYPSEAMMVIL